MIVIFIMVKIVVKKIIKIKKIVVKVKKVKDLNVLKCLFLVYMFFVKD